MSTIPLIIRAPNPNNQGFLSDLLMLKRSPGPRVRDAPSSTRRLPKKSSPVFRLPAIVTPQRRSLLDGTVLSNRRNGYRGCKRTTKFGLLSRAHVARTTRHSLLHAIKELRGHKVANDHDKGNITRWRTDCNLVLIS